MFKKSQIALCVAWIALAPVRDMSDTALVAVAANFAETAEALKTRFHEQSGHDLTLTTGSTGKLYAQIKAGAPF